ncbi:myosin-3-like [Plutella xylostella]|uniref:myosin-3-like n=1 Tax=Plutella xylostella TaxID=51655 RepID=UPI0020323FEF|nr:myosin-3-like [Plutella xylostella]
MDIGDISKVANRKRINADAEKLREKVSRETAKIIKLKVAQDTAYWDLKEKLHQLENNHERLQQNMVDVQMQHESISGQYQDELRLRPETINKLSSTREICDVLEEYSSRLKDTVSRCKADQAALADAYTRSGQFVKEVNLKHAQSDERHRVTVANLQDKLKLTTEHQAQLVTLFTTTQSQLESEARSQRARGDAALQQRDELAAAVGKATRELDLMKKELETKEGAISTLQGDMQRLLREATLRCAELQDKLDKKEQELKESTSSAEALKQALTNQEQFSASLVAQNSQLQERAAAAEDEAGRAAGEVAALQGKLEDLTVTSDSLRRDVAALAETKEGLEKEAAEQKQLLTNAATQIEIMTSQLDALQLDKSAVEQQLASASEEVEAKTAVIEELKSAVQRAEEKIAEVEREMEEIRVSYDNKILELTATLETKQEENTSKGETINKLMNDIKICMEVRSRLESNLDKVRRDTDAERLGWQERERALARQLEQLEAVNKDKEQELSKQMSIILEIRGEKEKLQEKISGMQNTIDNIQKELTGRAPPPARLPAEQDNDNAVSMTPLQKKGGAEFLRPRERTEKLDIFNIFSDSSMDGENMLDPVEVDRRFEAISRGERVRCMPLLKRRRAPPPPAPGTEGEQDTPISLSQVRSEIKSKGNTFFRNKRNEKNQKRFRKIGEAEENE